MGWFKIFDDIAKSMNIDNIRDAINNMIDDTKFYEIAGKIKSHPNYGKANPIDIGMEYGYTRETMNNFIKYAKIKRNRLEPDYAYVVLDKKDIYAVRLKDYYIKKIKEIESKYYKIKNNILVEIDGYGTQLQTVDWYDLNTCEKLNRIIVYSMDVDIKDIYILESGILIDSKNKIILYDYNGNFINELKLDSDTQGFSVVIEDKNGIYLCKKNTKVSAIHRIDKTLVNDEVILSKDDEKKLYAVGVENGEFCYYTKNKRINVITGEESDVAMEGESKQYYVVYPPYRLNGILNNGKAIDSYNYIPETIVLDDYVLSYYGIIRQKKPVSKELTNYLKENKIEQMCSIPSRNCIVGTYNEQDKSHVAVLDVDKNMFSILL